MKKYSVRKFIEDVGRFPLLLITFAGLVGIAMSLPGPIATGLAKGLGVSTQSLTLFAMIFILLALALLAGFGALALVRIESHKTNLLADAVIPLLSTMSSVVRRHNEILEGTTPSLAVEGEREQDEVSRQLVEVRSEINFIRRELEITIPSKVKESEDRLKSEWRFVVGLIALITLAIAPILLGALVLFKK